MFYTSFIILILEENLKIFQHISVTFSIYRISVCNYNLDIGKTESFCLTSVGMTPMDDAKKALIILMRILIQFSLNQVYTNTNSSLLTVYGNLYLVFVIQIRCTNLQEKNVVWTNKVIWNDLKVLVVKRCL